MSLVNKKSLYDKNFKGDLGMPVGQNLHSDSTYYTNEGQSDSPFNSNDHLQDLLEDNIVASDNSGLTYDPNQMIGLQPGPPAGDQDFDGIDGGQGYFHGIPNPGKWEGKQLGGVDLHEAMLTQAYTNNGVTVGPSPGPSGHSEFQDMNGSTTDFGIGFTNPETGNYDGKYANGLGPIDGHY